MVELYLMASSTYLTGLLHQGKGLYRASKDFQTLIPTPGRKQEMIRSGSIHLRSPQVGDLGKSMGLLSESNQAINLDPMIRKPVLIDVQDTRPNSVLFSFGIAEQCTRHEKILQFLMSGSNEAEKKGLDFSLVSDLMGLHTLAIDIPPQRLIPNDDDFCVDEIGTNEAHSSLVYPSRDLYAQKPLFNLVGDLGLASKFTVHSNGQVMFTGTGAEMKDLLSVVAEFHLSKNSKWRKQPVLVPHFNRLDTSKSLMNIQGSSVELATVTVTPIKSPQKIKLKPLPNKKSSRKSGKERDLYSRSSFHACESLLSLILYKRCGKTAILSLKKSSSEVPQLLNQFAAGIAGTGLAVLFSVVFKVAGGRASFSTTKLLNTGLGFGLVWLSWAVNSLRDTVVYVSKNSSKLGLKEKDIMKRVDRSMKDIFFRAATLMLVTALRFA